ncbi:MAG: Hsp20/alpha crystallin family protein [Lactobacillaceae bacterium]|nr:Hsp20/alpha crystallin family protein [Lactobacillaceae bacterium]
MTSTLTPFNPLSLFKDDFLTSISKDHMKTDIKELKTKVKVATEIPGVTKDNIDLKYNDDVLTISVKQSEFADHESEDGTFIHSERSTSNMSRSFAIPNIDCDNIKAKYKDGLLTVDLPKLKESQKEEVTGQIEIQ